MILFNMYLIIFIYLLFFVVANITNRRAVAQKISEYFYFSGP
jgi:hypothetical protein